jgi:hypothetical protein
MDGLLSKPWSNDDLRSELVISRRYPWFARHVPLVFHQSKCSSSFFGALVGFEGVVVFGVIWVKLNLNNHPRIKFGAGFLRVTSLVGQDTRYTEVVIRIEVRVSVNPKRNPTLLNERTEIGNKGRTQWAVGITGRL